MNRSERRMVTLFLVLFVLDFLFPEKAHAYLDPATGSYITQIIIAAVVGGLFVIKQYFNKIELFLKNLFSKKDNLDDER